MTYSYIDIKLQSFDHEILDFSCKEIIKLVNKYSIDLEYYIPLPTKKRIYCVLRSPHVDKDSREHFEIRAHKRVFKLYLDINEGEAFDKLKNLNLPAGVLYEIFL